MCKYGIFVAIICKYGIFVAKICKYGIFVAKICKYALNDSFFRFSGSHDSSASSAALIQENFLLESSVFVLVFVFVCVFVFVFVISR